MTVKTIGLGEFHLTIFLSKSEATVKKLNETLLYTMIRTNVNYYIFNSRNKNKNDFKIYVRVLVAL